MNLFGKDQLKAEALKEHFKEAPPSTVEPTIEPAPPKLPVPQLYAKVPTLLIREPIEADIKQIYELGLAIPELSCKDGKEWLSKEDVSHYVRYSHSDFLVAELQGKIIGFIITQKEGGWEHGCIIFLGVHPDFRNDGVGGYLVRQMESKMSVKDIYLLATSANAVEYFTNLGYQRGKTMTYMEKRLEK